MANVAPDVKLDYFDNQLQYCNEGAECYEGNEPVASNWNGINIPSVNGKDGCSTYVKSVASNQDFGGGKTGSVVTLAQNCPTGTTPAADQTLEIPYGEKGEQGIQGIQGPQGEKGNDGVSPTIQMDGNTIRACYGDSCTDVGTISLTNLCTSMYSDKTGTDERGDVYTMYCCIGDDCCQGSSCKPDTPVD